VALTPEATKVYLAIFSCILNSITNYPPFTRSSSVPAIVAWMPLIRESWYGNRYSPVLIYHKVATVSAAQAAIQTYNQHSQRTASNSSSCQETLFDEDNWARVMDAREIVYLVHPLIAALHESQIAPLFRTRR
jgi:hypothetical protein